MSHEPKRCDICHNVVRLLATSFHRHRPARHVRRVLLAVPKTGGIAGGVFRGEAELARWYVIESPHARRPPIPEGRD